MLHRRREWLLPGVAIVFAGILGAVEPRQTDTVTLKDLARRSLAKLDGELTLSGLRQPVEIIRDTWGIPHIFARSRDDLFFAQGYVMAQDRLWQMEMWRRGRDGRLAEILGPAAVAADRRARMTQYRGPMDDREWTSYHPEARRIFTAYANGINAFLRENANRLPVEFKLTGIRPEPWTPETMVLRAGGFADALSELRLARDVAELGAEEANRRAAPDPWDDLRAPQGLDVSIIGEEVIESLRAPGPLPRPKILEEYSGLTSQALNALAPSGWEGVPGSNNWVMGPRLSKTGRALLANDPHREVTNPSLRYIVHLNAPGWNVIGSGEPPFVGVAIGHNERVAWGLTIVGTDQQDVYVEEANPANPNEVLFNGRWEPLRVVREEIRVKSAAAQTIELKFSRHGVVFHEDRLHHRYYAIRSALAEPGTAPYLGSLRLDQVKDCREFLDAMPAWKAPSENMICADVDGNIAWQPAALSPSRKGWRGRLPVPGSGKYEWDGYRRDLPRSYNPASGWIATANHNIHPPGYDPPLMFKAPGAAVRINRIREMIAAQASFGIDDFKRMQHDALSTTAREDLVLFAGWTARSPEVEALRSRLAKWDAVLAGDSLEAALYRTWRRGADSSALDRSSPSAERNAAVEEGLIDAVDRLKATQGPDPSAWRWGRINTQSFAHVLLKEFDLPSVERRGGAGTVAANGATYREIFDVGNWDAALATNTPGQSGQPESEYYSNLLPLWSRDEYFPMLFTREAVEAARAHRLVLKPR